MIKRIIEKLPGYGLVAGIFATATFKQSSITFSGTFINGLLGAIFYIVLARFLGPSSFGLLSVAIVTLTLVSDIGDLGTDTGLVNFVSRYFNKDRLKAERFLKLGLKVKMIVGILVVVTGIVLSDFIATKLFVKPELINSLRISFVGVLAVLLFSFSLHYIQAMQRFWTWSGIQVGTNALRLALIFLLLYLGKLNIESALIVYIIIPLIGFLVALSILPRSYLKVDKETSVAREFFKYNKWVAAFTLIAAFSSRLDTFISARLLTSVELGLYSAASQLVKIVPQLVTAISTVIAPKMADTGSVKDFVNYLKKTQLLVLAIALLGLLSIPVVKFIFPIIFGSEYVASIPLFIVLLLAMLTFLVSIPIHNAVFYYFSYPKLFFYLGFVHLGIIAGFGWFLVSAYGAMGAAVSVLIGAVVNLIIPLVWVLRRLNSNH